MAVTQAVTVGEEDLVVESAAAGMTEDVPMASAAPPIPEPVPMATAAPPIPEPVAPEPVVESVSATPVEGVGVAISGMVPGTIEPVEVSPAFGLEVAPLPPQPPPSPAEADIPMASAVTAAIPATMASEPVFTDAASPAPVAPEPTPSPAPALEVPAAPANLGAIQPAEEPAVPVAALPPLTAEGSLVLHTPKLSPTPAELQVPQSTAAPPLAPPVEIVSEAPAPSPQVPPNASLTAPENIPMGMAFDGPATGFSDAPAEDATFPMGGTAAPPRRKGRKKLTTGTIVGLIIGAVLHLVFIVGIILWATGVFSPSTPEATKPRNAPRSATKAKTVSPATGYPMDNKGPKQPDKKGDVNPFDDLKD
jgi:hypothetical protein